MISFGPIRLSFAPSRCMRQPALVVSPIIRWRPREGLDRRPGRRGLHRSQRSLALRQKVIEAFQRYRTPLNMGIELPTSGHQALRRHGQRRGAGSASDGGRELETANWCAWRGRAGVQAGAAAGAPAPGYALLCRQSLSEHVRTLAKDQDAFLLPCERGLRRLENRSLDPIDDTKR